MKLKTLEKAASKHGELHILLLPSSWQINVHNHEWDINTFAYIQHPQLTTVPTDEIFSKAKSLKEAGPFLQDRSYGNIKSGSDPLAASYTISRTEPEQEIGEMRLQLYSSNVRGSTRHLHKFGIITFPELRKWALDINHITSYPLYNASKVVDIVSNTLKQFPKLREILTLSRIELQLFFCNKFDVDGSLIQ